MSFPFRSSLSFGLLAVSLTWLGNQASAQSPTPDISEFRFEMLDLGSGSPTGFVSDIVQDAYGFVWFGTREGAHRYDGYRLRTFAKERDKPDSLVNSVVEELFVDNENRLWIGTERGVSYYLPETESFRNYYLDGETLNSNLTNHVNSILQDSEGRIYASSESGYVYRFDESADQFLPINEAGLGIIKSMDIDPHDRLWIGSNGQLHMLDLKSGEITSYAEPFENDDPSLTNFIQSVRYVDEDSIWVGTSLNGALRLNPNTGHAAPVHWVYGGESQAHFIDVDSEGNVWVGHSSGLTIYRADGSEEFRYHSEMEMNALPGSAIVSVLRDRQGNVWVGSAFHGIFVSTNNKRFQTEKLYVGRDPGLEEVVTAVTEDGQGNLWVGLSSSGIDLFYADGERVLKIDNEKGNPDSLPEATVFRIFEDSLGEVWIGTYQGGLYRFKHGSPGLKRYRKVPGDESSLGGNDIRGIQEDEKGNLWLLAHGSGLSYFDRASETFSTISREEGSEAPTLLDNWAFTIRYTSGGKLLVGTAIGLSVYDPVLGSFENFSQDPDDPQSLSNPVINAIFEDSAGRLWLGTSDGLNRFHLEEGRFEHWSVEEGMPNVVVQSIVEDQDGKLWLGTNGGLARFDPETGEIDTYDTGDGISDNGFSAEAAVCRADGRVFFGTKNGLTYFDPDEIEDNRFTPEVWVSDFKVFNQSLEVLPESDGVGTLQKSILVTDRVVLRPDQKVISIDFVAINFIQSSKNEYAYRLKGFDADWNYVGTRREATYTNLNPGTYTFQVKASNNDGYWNESPRELEIVVLPPFWGTLWFRTIAGLIIVSIPAGILYLRSKATRRQKAMLEAKVSQRTEALRRANVELEGAYSKLAVSQEQIKGQNAELIRHRENLELMVSMRTEELELAKSKAERSDRLKSAFLANMSHEIRTPMNAIVGLLDVLQIDSLTEEERVEYRDIIRKSSETLLALIDDILDLSRIESGEAIIQLKPCNCDEVCEELFALFRHVASSETEGKVSLRLVRNGHSSDEERSWPDLVLPDLDPVRLRQILTNLLSNAIKFTDEGVVTLGYETLSEAGRTRVRFFVKDAGIGIAAAQLHRIFDRFHKLEAANGRVYRGTGLGLTISKRLTELMNGTIEVESEEGRGTTFYVDFERELENGRTVEASPEGKERSGNRNIETFNGLFAGKRILVAEDEERNHLVIEKFLSKTGVEMVKAYDGQDAIERFDEGSFDAVLLDIKMPIKDGYEVLRHIRAVNTSIPVLVQTAHAMKEDLEMATELGANRALAKPFTQFVLLKEVKSLILN